MKPKNLATIVALTLLIPATLLLAADKPAKKANVGGFVTEVLKADLGQAQEGMYFWLPYEFFIEVSKAQGNTDEQADRSLAMLKPYLIVLAMESIEDEGGTKAYATEDDIRTRSTLVSSDGTVLKPLNNIPPKVTTIAAAMKSAMSQQGDAASHMQLLFFPATANGKPAIDVNTKSKLTLKIAANETYKAVDTTWHTPFDALTPMQPCTKCHEPVSSKWNFCPYCGTPKTK